MRPNAFCYVALFGFVPVALILFTRWRLTISAAVVLFVGALFLPERVAYDPPLLPAFDKRLMVSLAAFMGCLVFRAKIFRRGGGRQAELLYLVIAAGLLGTSYTNPDLVPVGKGGWAPPIALSDIPGSLVRAFLSTLVPFLIGRSLFRESRDLRALMLLIVGSGLVYSFLVLLEVRLSPQLHIWVYGFHQHAWNQAFRAGGYRPTVFMAHGLTVAVFMMGTVCAAVSLAKARLSMFRVPTGLIALYLFIVLVLCKSMGALVLASAVVPIMLLLGPKGQVRLAAVLTVLAAAYPLTRMNGSFPTTKIVEIATEYGGPERSQSLQFRLDMDDLLVGRALERPFFGWGGYGRSALYTDMGDPLTVVDAQWTAYLCSDGIVGLFGNLLMLVLPVLVAARAMKKISSRQDRVLLSGLALIVALNLVDQTTNSMQSGLPLLFAGALMGLSRGLTTRPGAS